MDISSGFFSADTYHSVFFQNNNNMSTLLKVYLCIDKADKRQHPLSIYNSNTACSVFHVNQGKVKHLGCQVTYMLASMTQLTPPALHEFRVKL